MSDLLNSTPADDTPDSYEPIPSHVAAALLTTDEPYPPPLDQLLTLGEVWMETPEQADRRRALGITQAHLPDLLRMARDADLLDDWESDAGNAPLHAILAIAELDFTEYLETLIRLFDLDSDWHGERLPELLARAGQAAIAPLAAYLRDNKRWVFGQMRASTSLAEVAKAHPELRDQVVAILTEELRHAAENDESINGGLAGDLVELRAIESLPVIRAAFEADLIDDMIISDWLIVNEKLGLEPDPADPLVERTLQERQERQRAEQQYRRTLSMSATPAQRYDPADARKRKEKQKRKASAAARKVNKKRRKR